MSSATDKREAVSEPVLVVCANPALEITFPVESRWGRFSSCHRATWEPAGKGITVARVLKALRVPALLVGFSGGHIGRYITGCLTREGVDFQLLDVLPETRCSIAMVDPRGKATIVREDGPPARRSAHTRLLRLARRNLENASSLCISGSLPAGIGNHLYGDLCRFSRLSRKASFLDCAGPVLAVALKRKPFLIKLNREEAEATLGEPIGTDSAAIEALAKFRDLGAQNVLISLGKDGAVARIEESTYRIRVPNIPICSSVGSGDALMAGLLWAYRLNLSWEERLRLAMGVALSSTRFISSGHIDNLFSLDATSVRVIKRSSRKD